MAVEFYRYSYRTAEHDGDVEEYRASRDENRRCTEFIQHPQTGLYANAYFEIAWDDIPECCKVFLDLINNLS